MQFDIFADSGQTILRNDVIAALQRRDRQGAEEAIARLAAAYGRDPLRADLTLLADRLAPLPPFADRSAAAQALLRTDAIVVPAAQRVFGAGASAWLAPLWRALAIAADGLEFDPRDAIHAAAFSLRAGDWRTAAAQVKGIISWRRQPQTLAWIAEALSRDDRSTLGDDPHDDPDGMVGGFAAAWPLLAELAWLAPARFGALADRLDHPPLAALRARFAREFDADPPADDWFPAWAVIADPALAGGLRSTWTQTDAAPERAARLLTQLLSLERQGRHQELISGRRTLRDTDERLFAFYMQSR